MPTPTAAKVIASKASSRAPSTGSRGTGSGNGFGGIPKGVRGSTAREDTVARSQPFLRVVALEKLLLQLALDRQRALHRDLPAGLHRPLDAPDRLGCFVRRTVAPRILHHAIPPLPPTLLGRP